jgi:SapB morphogen precursor RamS
MSILDLQDMKIPETVAGRSSHSKHRCGGGGDISGLSLLLCR